MKKRNILIIISLLAILSILIFLVVIFVYKNNNKKENKEINISLQELSKKIQETNEFDYKKMQDIDKDFATSTFLIDVNKIQDIIGKSPIINTKPSMYVIIKTQKENLQDVRLALESYSKEYETEWSTYLPDQYELVKNRKIGIIGNYVYMVISENPDKIIKLLS